MAPSACQQGTHGLTDRSSRPARSPRRRRDHQLERALALRREQRLTYALIAERVGLSKSTAARAYQAGGLARLATDAPGCSHSATIFAFSCAPYLRRLRLRSVSIVSSYSLTGQDRYRRTASVQDGFAGRLLSTCPGNGSERAGHAQAPHRAGVAREMASESQRQCRPARRGGNRSDAADIVKPRYSDRHPFAEAHFPEGRNAADALRARGLS